MPATHTCNCPEIRELFAYLDGSTQQSRKALIEKHLNICTSCFEAFLMAFNSLLDSKLHAKQDGARRASARHFV